MIKGKDGWHVLFVYRDENHFSPYWPKELPLHPDEYKFWSEKDAEFYHNMNAEFEIVTEGDKKYAKFFHKFVKESPFITKKAKTIGKIK